MSSFAFGEHSLFRGNRISDVLMKLFLPILTDIVNKSFSSLKNSAQQILPSSCLKFRSLDKVWQISFNFVSAKRVPGMAERAVPFFNAFSFWGLAPCDKVWPNALLIIEKSIMTMIWWKISHWIGDDLIHNYSPFYLERGDHREEICWEAGKRHEKVFVGWRSISGCTLCRRCRFHVIGTNVFGRHVVESVRNRISGFRWLRAMCRPPKFPCRCEASETSPCQRRQAFDFERDASRLVRVEETFHEADARAASVERLFQQRQRFRRRGQCQTCINYWLFKMLNQN